MPLVKSPYPPVPELPDLNHFTLLFERAPGKDHPRDYVVQVDIETGEQRTHGEFVDRIRDCATGLSAPVEQGGLDIRHTSEEREIIVIFAPNCLDFAVLVHAALLLTIPFALLPSKPTLGELVDLLNKLKSVPEPARLRLFVHPSLLRLALQGIKQAGISSEYVYSIGGQPKGKHYLGVGSLVENVRRRNLARHPVVPARKDTLAYLLFSSGTGGTPKAVMVSHGNLCFALIHGLVKNIEDATFEPYPQGPPQRFLASLPFYHSYGLHYFVLKPPLVPRTSYILPRWSTEQAVKAIEKYKIEFLISVPSIIYQLVHSPASARADLSSIRGIACGAAYLPPELGEKFRQLIGRKVQSKEELPSLGEGYGLSEATISCIAGVRPGQFGVTPGPHCTGVLFPGLEARIVREDGSEADFGEPGELLIHGDSVALGYWGDETATRSCFLPDKWLRTGDRFRVDEQGVFYYEDRLKDTLKISGAQVSPMEIEETLLSHPRGLLVDATVSGIPSELAPSSTSSTTSTPGITRDDRVPRAWVVLGPAGIALGRRKTIEELDAWVRERLSRYKWLTGGIEIVDEIPKNPTGKVLRRVLVDGYIDHAKRKRTKARL